jgi:transcriptional regulator with XRE-family HTH domain
MVTGRSTPSVVRRQLGRRLRRLRDTAGKTAEDVSITGVASRAKLWRIESGRVVVSMGDVLALARVYGADNEVVDELVRLADATKGTGYAEEFKGAVRESVWLYADLEAGAALIADYNCELVPGLLQSEDYVRAVMQDTGSLTRPVVDRRVAFRLQRQRAVFDRPRPARVEAVITAGALSVQVGSAAVMAAQREHLRALGSRDGVSIRVLPFENGLHPAMNGPFVILDFDDPDDPSLVHVEDIIGSRYIDRADHVARFRAAFERVRARAVPVEDYLR